MGKRQPLREGVVVNFGVRFEVAEPCIDFIFEIILCLLLSEVVLVYISVA
jgi:hypothetical protein